MANLTYRTPGAVAPTTTTVKDSALTYEEMDGNWKSIADETDVAKNTAKFSNRVLTGVSGSNTITATSDPITSQYALGQVYHFVAVADNTGPVTININGLGAKSITKTGDDPLGMYNLRVGQTYAIFYDGTKFQLSSSSSQATAGFFFENDNTVTQNYTFTPGKNAMSAGPITVAPGITVTVPVGSAWTVV